MYPCLVPGSISILKGQEATDLNGTVFQAQMLKNMAFPWSTNQLLNAPSGERFWNVFAVPQAIHWGALWSLTRFLSPVLALNYWLLIGWILSGVSAYVLARYIKVSVYGSLVAGLLVEMLPWLREKASTHMAYVFLCVPLFAVLLALRHFDDPSKRSFLSIIGYLGLIFFFDLYWFYFVLMIFCLIAIMNIKSIFSRFKGLPSRLKLTISGIASAGIVASLGLLVLVKNLTTADQAFGRPLEPTTNSYIDEFNGSISRFIVPWSDHFLVKSGFFNSEKLNSDAVIYGGMLIIGISVVGMMCRAVNRKAFSRDQVTILVVAVSFLSLTVPSRVSVLNLEISTPVSLFKYLMPGVRHFARSGMVAQALFCVLAAATIDSFFRLNRKSLAKTSLIVVIAGLCIIDLSPLTLREARSAYSEFEGIREALSRETSPVLYSFSPNIDAGNYLNVKSVRRSYDHDWNTDFEVQAALGDENFASYLVFRGVTHVLIPYQEGNSGSYFAKWGTDSSIDLKFPDTLFERIPTSTNGSPAILYKVLDGSGDNFCVTCVRYKINWSGVRQAFFDPVTASISPDQQASESLSWVLPTESPSFTVSTNSTDELLFAVSIDLVAAYGPNAQPQIVQFTSNIESKTFRVVAGSITKAEIRVRANEPVRLLHFLPCTVPANLEPGNPDTRKICFGVVGVSAEQISELE
jgi:hypothetical protein